MSNNATLGNPSIGDYSQRPTALLVHGAFHGGWVWQKVATHLSDLHWPVETAELPSVAVKGGRRFALRDDAAVVRRHLLNIAGPVVVVAHSYGGMTVTQAAAGMDNVHHILYLAAFQLDIGQSLLGAVGREPEWWIVEQDTITADRPRETFYADVPEADAVWAQNQLRPSSYAAMTDRLTEAAWRTIASTYVICEHDRAIPALAQEQMAQQATSIHRLPSSHSPMLSRATDVAQIINDLDHGPTT
jgi:pimeloyl-ACP methyl ester carboxylesterase